MQPRTLTYNAFELRPVGRDAIAIGQDENVVLVTLDQLHQFTSDLCILAASMREDMRNPLGEEE